jgi:hypothetical protein
MNTRRTVLENSRSIAREVVDTMSLGKKVDAVITRQSSTHILGSRPKCPRPDQGYNIHAALACSPHLSSASLPPRFTVCKDTGRTMGERGRTPENTQTQNLRTLSGTDDTKSPRVSKQVNPLDERGYIIRAGGTALRKF